MRHFDASPATETGKKMVSQERGSANQEFQNVDDDADSNEVAVFDKKLPPVPVVQEYVSDLYSTDIFHSIKNGFKITRISKEKLPPKAA